MINIEVYKRDPALWFFGSTALAFLIVSVPATYAIVAPFHNGWLLTVAMLLALEVGAVGCKLAGLAVPAWAKWLNLLTIMLLLLTTIANYAAGSDALASAKLPPTLAEWKAEGWGWVFATIYAGIVPLFLFVFLSLATKRVAQLSAAMTAAPPSLAEQRDQLVIETITMLREHVRPLPELADTKADMIRRLASLQVEQGVAPTEVSTEVIRAATGFDRAYVQQVVSRWRAEQR
jgi:hypothetical protein